MTKSFAFRRAALAALAALMLAGAGLPASIVVGSLAPAMAQAPQDFEAALDAYGHWVQHAPYGEVWVPDGVPPDWRPYENGHWVYTDDWGWYWISDDSEEDWGWVVYHYGRWAFDGGIGWFWIPGDEWAPAWVDWRYGDDTVGWAPLPPDDLIDAYDEQPDYWVFVPLRYIGAPALRSYYLPPPRRTGAWRATRLVNRPVHIQGRRIWVNPGLAPGFIAGRTRLRIDAYQVRPRVFANTNVQGGITVRAQDLHTRGAIRRVAPVTVQRTTTVFQPSTAAPAPLGKNAPGVLGPHPPRAAQGTTVAPTAPPAPPSPKPPAGTVVPPKSTLPANPPGPQPQPRMVQPPKAQPNVVNPQPPSPSPQPHVVQPPLQPKVQPQAQPHVVQPPPSPPPPRNVAPPLQQHAPPPQAKPPANAPPPDNQNQPR